MYKKLLSFLFIIISVCLISGCHKRRTIILFNHFPITKENILNNSSEFKADKPIYYIFISEKPLNTDLIRIRILKRDSNANNEVTGVVYSNDFRMKKNQIYYYDNYIVLRERGTYCMAVYARNKLDMPLATADFQVK